ncbi:hypothetical protein D3C73_1428030 [compost metagenome]
MHEYEKGNFIDSIDEIAYKNSVNILLLDFNGKPIYNSNIVSGSPREFKNDIVINTTELVNALLKSENGNIGYTKQITKFKSQMFVYGQVVPKGNICLVMIAPIDPIDSTTNVLQNQLIYITFI